MSEIVLDKASFWPLPLSERNREGPFKIALAGSLLIHAVLLAALPGFRAVNIEPPEVLNVEIVEEQALRPDPVPRSRSQVAPVPRIEPAPLPPVDVEREVLPSQPRRDQPEPARVPDPVIRQPQPVAPPPQAEIIRPVPRPERRQEQVAMPEPQPRSLPPQEPPQVAPVDVPPPAPVPRAEPSAPPEQPRVEATPVPRQEAARIAPPDVPQVAAPTPPAPVQLAPAREVAPAPEAEQALVANYEQSLSALIRRHEKYPDRARRQGWEGTAVVGLSLSADGKVRDIAVVESSGREILDDAAVQMVRRAAPLPRAPEPLRGRERMVRIPIVFKLDT